MCTWTRTKGFEDEVTEHRNYDQAVEIVTNNDSNSKGRNMFFTSECNYQFCFKKYVLCII